MATNKSAGRRLVKQRAARGWSWSKNYTGMRVYRHAQVHGDPVVMRLRAHEYYVGTEYKPMTEAAGPFETFEAAEIHWRMVTGIA